MGTDIKTFCSNSARDAFTDPLINPKLLDVAKHSFKIIY